MSITSIWVVFHRRGTLAASGARRTRTACRFLVKLSIFWASCEGCRCDRRGQCNVQGVHAIAVGVATFPVFGGAFPCYRKSPSLLSLWANGQKYPKYRRRRDTSPDVPSGNPNFPVFFPVFISPETGSPRTGSFGSLWFRLPGL